MVCLGFVEVNEPLSAAESSEERITREMNSLPATLEKRHVEAPVNRRYS